MYSGALRTFYRWYECRDGWQHQPDPRRHAK